MNDTSLTDAPYYEAVTRLAPYVRLLLRAGSSRSIGTLDYHDPLTDRPMRLVITVDPVPAADAQAGSP